MGKAWLPPRLSYAQRAIAFSLENCRFGPDIMNDPETTPK